MNTKTRKFPLSVFVMFLAMLVLATSACSFLTPRLGEISQVVEVSLDEQMFSETQPSFQIHNHDFWEDLDVDVDRMELHAGILRFLGTKIMPDGSRADCSIDVHLGAEDGRLTARIIALDIPGMKLTDPVVVSINQDLEADLPFKDYDKSAEVLFQEVEVTEDALRMKILVNIRF